MSPLSSQSISLRKTPPITDTEFHTLRDFIYKLTGIDVPERRKYLLETRLGARLKALELRNFKEYFKFLTTSTDRKKEINLLFEKITTNETSFFRDIKQLGVFKMFALKNIIDAQTKSGKKELNIWCAGCSSGEEAYTLSIMLHEILKMSILSWKISIFANDLSPAVIAKAKRGVYNDYSLRNTPKEIVSKYFTAEPGGYKVHPKIQKPITFQALNLNDSLAIKRIKKSHVVFCRNVIIYFDDAMKRKVVNHFYDNLLPEGYLVIGHSESLHKYARFFIPQAKPGGIMYKKAK
ncbi:CheR family methyltransferase [Desulfoplanes sp.]